MSKKWSKQVLSNNVIQFTRGDDTLFAPEIIGKRYVIEDVLSASGGFGIIYVAQDTRLLGRKVLIKARRYDKEEGLFSYKDDVSRKGKIETIRKQIHFEFDCLLLFRRQGESRMPNVNDIVYDFSPSIHGPHKSIDGSTFTITDPELVNEEPYIVMQMIEGKNLGDLIEPGVNAVLKDREYDHYRFWERDVLQYGREICTIFEGFHQKDKSKRNAYYIYQDLKPENIMITYGTFITLIDFGGMTLVMDDQFGRPNSNYQGFGSPGLSTWGYKAQEMSEEMGMLDQLDQRVDVYAIGATLYHLLTGDDPTKFAGEYDPIPVEKLRKFPITNATYELIEKATKPNREERYANTKEMSTQIYQAFSELKKF